MVFLALGHWAKVLQGLQALSSKNNTTIVFLYQHDGGGGLLPTPTSSEPTSGTNTDFQAYTGLP